MSSSLSPPTPLADPSVLAHVVDAHCHPTDSPISPSDFSSLPHKVCAMSTRASDQALVRQLALDYPDRVIPCFGSYLSLLFKSFSYPYVSTFTSSHQPHLTAPANLDSHSNTIYRVPSLVHSLDQPRLPRTSQRNTLHRPLPPSLFLSALT